MCANCFEHRVRRSDEQDVRTLDETRPQGVNFELPTELTEYDVEVLDEQDQPLAALLTEVS